MSLLLYHLCELAVLNISAWFVCMMEPVFSSTGSQPEASLTDGSGYTMSIHTHIQKFAKLIATQLIASNPSRQ